MPRLSHLLLLSLFLFALAHGAESNALLEFERLDLTDGRKLKKVVVKAYDSEKGRLLLVASGKAMFIALDLVPEPFRQNLRLTAPKSGSSTSSMQSTTPPSAARPRLVQPTYPRSNAPTSQAYFDAGSHKQAALQRAQNYYRYEFKAGSDNITVTAINFETDDPEAITGWEGRYRIQGRVFLEYFDSRGYSFNRTTDRFEIITEQKDRGSIKVVDFTRK